jgi:hypothetical protein
MSFYEEDREYDAYIEWLGSPEYDAEIPEDATQDEIDEAWYEIWQGRLADEREEIAEHMMSFWE